MIGRKRVRLMVMTATAVVSLAMGTGASAQDINDPSVFGPGEPWPRTALGPGSSGPRVAELQQALNDAGFRVAQVDGSFGSQTIGAVHAFQKHHDLERDAVFRPEDWDMLGEPPEPPGVNGEPNRIEVDLDRQILYLFEDAEVTRVLPVSSGNGASYVNGSGSTVVARTPEGRFAFNRQRPGWHESYLGFMYAPLYFRGNYAIHGSSSVPAYPASHGCVRVTISDMDYLRQSIGLGLPVYVYGNRIERADLLPEPPTPIAPPDRMI